RAPLHRVRRRARGHRALPGRLSRGAGLRPPRPRRHLLRADDRADQCAGQRPRFALRAAGGCLPRGVRDQRRLAARVTPAARSGLRRMTDLHFGGLLLVVTVAFAAPFLLGLAPRLPLPSVVVEIVAGIVIGPSVLGSVHIDEPFGQLVVAAGTIADFGGIILLSLFFSGQGGVGATVVLLAGLFGIGAAVLFAVRGAERSKAVMRDLVRLQDTTAQIRVRGAWVLMIGFVALAEAFGLEAILGAFAAGAILTLVDSDNFMTHPLFRRTPEAVGFGVFIPVFFV